MCSCFFFFKQKTAYEMRISDWSSDVCSSDLLDPYDKGYTHFCVDATDIELEYERLKKIGMTFSQPGPIDVGHVKSIYGRDPEGNLIETQQTADHRSEERRVGKEGVSTCRSRW